MRRDPTKYQPSFEPTRLRRELQAEHSRKDGAQAAVLGSRGVESNQQSAPGSLVVPKRPTFLTVGRVVTGLSAAREAAKTELEAIDLELCEVNDVGVCAYIHRDEIRKKNRNLTQKYWQRRSPRHGRLPRLSMEKVDDVYDVLTNEHEFPAELSLVYGGLKKVPYEKVPQVAAVFLQFDRSSSDFGGMLQERDLFRAKGNFQSDRDLSRLCLLGEVVDYGSEGTSEHRWAKAQKILTNRLGTSLTTSPIEFTSGIPDTPLYGPNPYRPNTWWADTELGRCSDEFSVNTDGDG